MPAEEKLNFVEFKNTRNDKTVMVFRTEDGVLTYVDINSPLLINFTIFADTEHFIDSYEGRIFTRVRVNRIK